MEAAWYWIGDRLVDLVYFVFGTDMYITVGLPFFWIVLLLYSSWQQNRGNPDWGRDGWDPWSMWLDLRVWLWLRTHDPHED